MPYWEAAADGPSIWVPATHKGDSNIWLLSLAYPCLKREAVNDRPLCLPPFLPAFQIKRSKQIILKNYNLLVHTLNINKDHEQK